MVVACRIPHIWHIPKGNKPIHGSGHSHAYCKPSSLNLVDSVWLEDLSERFPAEWEQVSTQVRLQGGPSLDPAPIPRIEWVFKLGLGWSGWVQVQWIARGWLVQKQVRHLHLQEAGGRNQAKAWQSLGLHMARKRVQHLRLQEAGGRSQAQAQQSFGLHTIKGKKVS